MTSFLRNPVVRSCFLGLGAVAATLLLFPGTVTSLLRADQFMPHATCYLRNPGVIFLHVSSDLAIGFAYVSISTTLGYLVYKARAKIPFHWMFLAFGLFIITCGFTHFMEVWTVWRAVYWLAGYVKVICALASVVTAIALFPLVPKVFALIEAVKMSEDRKVKLERANEELEAFAYSVSHDLRAPLRAVQGMARALQEDYGQKLEPGAHEYTDRIMDASKRMDALIRDMLEYSRITRTEFEVRPVRVESALAAAQSSIAEDLKERQAEIRIEGSFPGVLAEPTLLTQVFLNLLSNAIKFVAPGTQPQVQIYARDAGRKVRVCVQDNGIGIATQYQEKIFRMFERLHSVSEYPGTGIGLAIAQKAMVRMNGSLGVESEAGQGSLFWIELPKA